MPNTHITDIFDAVTDGIYFLNTDSTITYWSRGAEMLAGYSPEEVLGTRCKDNLLRHVDENGDNLCENGCPLGATMHDGITREANVFMHHKLGHRVFIRVKSIPLKDTFGRISGAAEIFTKIDGRSDLIHELESLRQEAMTDPLTGMANRRCMDMATAHFDEHIKTKGQRLGVLFIDIDRFKAINDNFGHDTGDKVLTMVSKTILSAIRPTNLASRWGGDEFIILAPETGKEGLKKPAERVRKLIEQSWINIEKEQISVTASIGGAVVKPEETISSAINRADQQAYLSKNTGRNCVHIAE